MSECGKVTIGAGTTNGTTARATEKKAGRRWVRWLAWVLAIVLASLLVSGTMAALLWCN